MDPLTWIANMRGPEFLVVYTIFSLVVLGAAAVWARRCDPAPAGAALPGDPRASTDPYELAWLRDESRGIIATALVALRQRGAIAVDDHRARQAAPASGLGPIEAAVFDALRNPRRPSELLGDAYLKAVVARQTAAYESKYARAGLLTTPSERTRAALATAAGIAAVLGLGAYKLTAALSTGHRNVGFLILIGLAVSAAVAVVCRPKRLNARGRAYLARLRNDYGAFGAGHARTATTESMLPLYVAVLGPAALAGTSYDDLRREMRPASHGGSGGSCSSSCSGGSSCSSSGGSSCGGGGGCGGGGCGGCGGG